MNRIIRIVYDKQCPICHHYCQLAERHMERDVELIDAREASALMAEITKQGLDVDEGMVVELDGVLHYGAEAIHLLATIQPPTGAFNVTNAVLFRNASVARCLYPILRFCRNLLLKARGVKRINNLRHSGKDRF